MARMVIRPLPALAGLTALAAFACEPHRGDPIRAFEMIDYTPAAMVRQMASSLRQPFVVEFPLDPKDARFDLKMHDVDARAVLDAIQKLEPRYQYELRKDVVIYWPAGEAESGSPWSKVVPEFRGKGGLFSVTRDLLVQSGMKDVQLESKREGQNRPVDIVVKNQTYREVFARLAVQAHVGFDISPDTVRIVSVPQ